MTIKEAIEILEKDLECQIKIYDGTCCTVCGQCSTYRGNGSEKELIQAQQTAITAMKAIYQLDEEAKRLMKED
jgi:uncharacterized protein YuzB (UPF0349 family)